MKKMIALAIFSCLAIAVVSAQKTPAKLLRHVVMFKFKDDASAEGIKSVEDAFMALKGKISLIKDVEWGTNNSPEKLNEGLTHCFFVTFASEKDRDDYLVHPAHLAFVTILKPYLDKAVVLDYWAKK
ncbi:Dabb family protein [Ferruginibacter sp.]|uniref:Dabb family protein n=1 Tax=Ferruginibacter sp. TaxID=1940288 RepID=UPI002658F051|nr:Dabb family protein [Ferruginibacter sp.]